MSTIAIEIGNHTIKAALYDNRLRKVKYIPLTSYGSYLLPSACIIDTDRTVLYIGEQAILGKSNFLDQFYYKFDLNDGSQEFYSFVIKVTDFILSKAYLIDKDIEKIVFVCKKGEMFSLGLKEKLELFMKPKRVSLSYACPEQNIILLNASVKDGEYVLLFDVGETKTIMTIFQRKGGTVMYVGTKYCDFFSAQIVDSLIIEDIEHSYKLKDFDDDLSYVLYNNELEKAIEYIKCSLSYMDVVTCPIPGTKMSYECTKEKLQTLILEKISITLAKFVQMVRDNKIDANKISSIMLLGSTNKLQFIQTLLKTYIGSELNIEVKTLNLAINDKSELLGCESVLQTNEESVKLINYIAK